MTAMTDEQILDLWSPRLGDGVQRPVLGKNKIIAFGRACAAAERARADALQAERDGFLLSAQDKKRLYQDARTRMYAAEARADALEAALRTVRMRLEVAHRLLDIASGPSGARAAFKKIDEAIADIDTAARALLEKPHD